MNEPPPHNKSGKKDTQKVILPRTGVYIPLYMYPNGTGWRHWQTIIDAKISHPTVPLVAVINPDNGSGSLKDNNFVNAINKIKEVGIVVLGYVYTKYGERSPDVVKAEINNYKIWYNPDGIMFDEMSNRVGFEKYYYDLNCYAKSLGMKFTKGNPGTDVPPSYVGIVDSLGIHETSGYPPMVRLAGWHTKYGKENWSYCSYDVMELDEKYVMETSRYVGLIYVTDGKAPNPYHAIPKYFEQLASILDC